MMRRHWQREKGRVMERKTGRKEKGEASGGVNHNDMEMIVPAAYDAKHFHPVIFPAPMSRREP